MSHRIGTHHFRDRYSAVSYYRPYGYTPADVDSKLKRGEIAIGTPRQVDGELYPAFGLDRDGRYWIALEPESK